jgi:epsilon-lactone hydrolase
MEIDSNKINTDRAFFDSLGNSYPADSTVKITTEQIAGVTCYWFVPRTFDEVKIIIYLHGGMFGFGSIRSHKPMVSHFASALSAKVLFIEYALAPEKPFPNGLNDAIKVYRELIGKESNSKIVLIGDSAGGGLAVSLIKKATEEKLQVPSCVILISPWLYLKCDTASHETRKKMEQVLTRDMLVEYANYYVANNNWRDADPSQFSLNSFPPLFILVGSNEILFDDSKLFYEKIKPLRSDTKIKEYINQNHVWLLADIKSEGSKNALTDINEFISESTNH